MTKKLESFIFNNLKIYKWKKLNYDFEQISIYLIT